MSIREPAVAGMFYRDFGLQEELEHCFLGPGGPGQLPVVNAQGPRRIVGLVSPHAGLMYSGSVAAHAYYELALDGLPDVAVIIGPNHRSYLPPVALADDAEWRTPLGVAALDTEIIHRIAEYSPFAAINSSAHALEHSLEVQLPFLQYIGSLAGGHNIRIVPILIGAAVKMSAVDGVADFVRGFGDAIARALDGRNAVIIASTDFTHYESTESAGMKDSRAISQILSLDEEALMRTVDEYDISMCGVLPTAITIAACKHMGATSARKLAYRTSGDVTGDNEQVVGYGALAITRLDYAGNA